MDKRTQDKIDNNVSMLKTIYVLSAKFVKKIIDTDFYEMRVLVGINEYRTILFAVDHDNLIQTTKIILLNGFLKKSSKDYDRQLKKRLTH